MLNAGIKQELMVVTVLHVLSVFSASAVLNNTVPFFIPFLLTVKLEVIA